MLLHEVLFFFLLAGFCNLFNLVKGFISSSFLKLCNGLEFVIISWPVSVAPLSFYKTIDQWTIWKQNRKPASLSKFWIFFVQSFPYLHCTNILVVIPWVVVVVWGGGKAINGLHVLWAIIPVHARMCWSGHYVCMSLSLFSIVASVFASVFLLPTPPSPMVSIW